MPTFRDDIDSDLDEIFSNDGFSFARGATFRRVDTGTEFSVRAYSMELMYSPFDPRNQGRFYLRLDQLNGYIPRPNDEVIDTEGTGETFSVLNVLVEENIVSLLTQRMDLRQ